MLKEKKIIAYFTSVAFEATLCQYVAISLSREENRNLFS